MDLGAIKDDGSRYHSSSVPGFTQFLRGAAYLCGHNILQHDLKYIREAVLNAGINPLNVIDTLYLSPLLFPTNPYHKLLKDDKLQSEEANNPLNDSIKARDLFYDELAAFGRLEEELKQIFYLLLHDQAEFAAFFRYMGYTATGESAERLIRKVFRGRICEHADLEKIVRDQPVALAYCLSLSYSFIRAKKEHSITPAWVLRNYPEVESIMFTLRSTPCLTGCAYCNEALDVHKGLKKFFGFDAFRDYDGEPLQEKAVKAAMENKSIIAVFPTGGGKSITFQLPALMAGENSKGLTVVISPLQSLMKDQVDNLEGRNITDAVTINGLLDPIERSKSIERIAEGSASLLYISPESLRSKTVERLILGRKISRFVIDEAHCFSSWGQDFRVDYLYIGDFIKSVQEAKNLPEGIPVSCFTATAKQNVIEDIRAYFREKLDIELELFTSRSSRTNLQYRVFKKSSDEEKYQALRGLVEEKSCPTIVYVSRTARAEKLAERLRNDGLTALAYHGRMEAKEKTANQNAFMEGKVPTMVATSAFGMGVDKSDVRMVVHYDISDSLENYVQEAGRAGRDQVTKADCFVLFDEEDLSKHFLLLNQTRLSIKEIQQVWQAIKNITRFRNSVSNSALEIARKAGWDDNVSEIETRVTTAIAALEDAGYLKRGQNMPQVFADSILSRNAQEAIDKINASEKFEDGQKENAARIIRKLFSSRSRKQGQDAAESRVDYISDHLGIKREEVIKIVNLLREEDILAQTKDLTAFIRKGENRNRSLSMAETFAQIENFFLPLLEQQEKTFHFKELNEAAEMHGCADVSPARLKTILNFWSIKNWIRRRNHDYSRNHFTAISLHPEALLKEKLEKRHELAEFIIRYLYEKVGSNAEYDRTKEESLVEFSVHELKSAYDNGPNLFKLGVTIDDIEDTLFYLSRIEALKIDGGFLVVYNRLTIERLEKDNYKKYTKDDYKKLNQFYESKVQQIHIVGEYAKKMIADYRDALQFVEDYFQLNYASFLRKYFPGNSADQLKLKMTPGKFRQLFGELSPTQLKIINDSQAKHIVVAAGPGSGKTKILVHKLASLLLMEDVKHEQLLMVTFSRAAATEFKKRLLKLIGNAAHFVEIKTFHSYCFDLLGKMGSVAKSGSVLKEAVEKIRAGEAEPSQITKMVLVVDEAQDMDRDEYDLIVALMEQNEEMKVIAVGDDDQNIYEFRGASSEYLERLIVSHGAVMHELVDNYRSKANLVDFSNQFAQRISHRLKDTPVIAKQPDNGNIEIVKYRSHELVVPVVNKIATAPLTGTTCVLTKTNHEALQITGLLTKVGINAKLIQSTDGFSLDCLLEARFFLEEIKAADDAFIISEDTWNVAKQNLQTKFARSNKLEICNNLIKALESISPGRKYRSDLESFIRESRPEDFFNENGETIFVSTIHKSKGKEFDNVFLLLDNFNDSGDSAKRQLYVALTRAKQNLSIHLNSNLLDNISAENLERAEDTRTYLPTDEIVMHPGHKDVWLGGFANKQHVISQLASGDRLAWNGEECLTTGGQPALRFSHKFAEEIERKEALGYQIKSVKVNFILFWFNEQIDRETLIVLPEVCFGKAKKE